VFARALFERALPGVQLVDTAAAIARQTGRFASELTERGDADADVAVAPPLRMWSSGSPQVLANFARRWLDLRVDVQDMHC
jgi:glutamate racemase